MGRSCASACTDLLLCPSLGSNYSDSCRGKSDDALRGVVDDKVAAGAQNFAIGAIMAGALVGEVIIAVGSHGVAVPASAPIMTLTAASMLFTLKEGRRACCEARAAAGELERRRSAGIRVQYNRSNLSYEVVEEEAADGGLRGEEAEHEADARRKRQLVDIMLSDPGSAHELR